MQSVTGATREVIAGCHQLRASCPDDALFGTLARHGRRHESTQKSQLLPRGDVLPNIDKLSRYLRSLPQCLGTCGSLERRLRSAV